MQSDCEQCDGTGKFRFYETDDKNPPELCLVIVDCSACKGTGKKLTNTVGP